MVAGFFQERPRDTESGIKHTEQALLRGILGLNCAFKEGSS